VVDDHFGRESAINSIASCHRLFVRHGAAAGDGEAYDCRRGGRDGDR